MERMSMQDARYFYLEDDNVLLHIGACAVDVTVGINAIIPTGGIEAVDIAVDMGTEKVAIGT